MEITFNIHYTTKWGEQIAITGDHPELGGGDPKSARKLNYQEGGSWSGQLFCEDKTTKINYRYILVDNNGNILEEEFDKERILDLKKIKSQKLKVLDYWRLKTHQQNSLYSTAFQEVIFQQKNKKGQNDKTANCFFQIHAPRIETGMQIAVVGNTPALGNWDLTKPVLLNNQDFPLWSAGVTLPNHSRVEYKYGIYDPKAKRIAFLEAGTNRSVNLQLEIGAQQIVTDEVFRHPKGDWRGVGVAMPVFSLRTKKSLGVGEFTDIPALVDWAKQVDFNMVQILPVNDTTATHTWVDSYPYAAISVFALHPLYLNLESIDGFKIAIDKKTYQKEQKALNALSQVDYEAVIQLKWKWSRAIFDATEKEFLTNDDFLRFMEENKHWVKPYAAFCYLRDKYKTPDFNQWKTYGTYNEQGLNRLTSPKSKQYSDIAFYYFLQYHLDKQLHEATEYARKKGIVLKGDIPIGIYRYSVDAWVEPQLYNMNGQAGAPPDPFSATGQNWGFPTYNWEEMAKDGFQWWKNRFQQLARYFDAFRIDHILGFFRIWEIPLQHVEGNLGFFNPAIPIQRAEFHQRGISFDYERFCQPYVREHNLHQLFGELTNYVKDNFLEETQSGVYQFKSALNTQRKVLAHLDQIAHPNGDTLKAGLFQLLGNVLFFEVPDSNETQFHPRIDFHQTNSFQNLPHHIQAKLKALHDDYFYNRQEEFWRAQAMTKLPAIRKATEMLICGEDLGMVPAVVPGVMKELNILSLEIQRMSKNPETEFLQATDIPYSSVCSPSTHDMAPLRAWWEEMDIKQRARFYYQQLGQQGSLPETCEPWVAEKIMRQQLSWYAMWVVFPMQDILAIDEQLRYEDPHFERINVPANPQHYWRYRLHLNLEDLLKEKDFNERVREMVLGRE